VLVGLAGPVHRDHLATGPVRPGYVWPGYVWPGYVRPGYVWPGRA
jgi:hypothetical protein